MWTPWKKPRLRHVSELMPETLARIERMMRTHLSVCPACRGSGDARDLPCCQRCGGSGRIDPETGDPDYGDSR